MKVQQILNCSFPTWYPNFKKHTWRSIVIPLSEEFVEYLKADGVVLPDGSLETTHATHGDGDDRGDDDANTEKVEWDEAEAASEAPSFPHLDAQIKEAINKLGGSVFPKLNWSCPKDATWISLNNSMKCVTPGDIYLLLKSSEFISHDLMQPFKDCEDASDATVAGDVKYVLVLRKWLSLNPSSEFRCFVKNGAVVGISQRDCTNCYHHISLQKDEILQDVMSFYNEVIGGKFPDNDYTFDVYRETKDVVKLIDFNPFGKTTDSLLFEWDDLNNAIDQLEVDNKQKPPFKCVTGEVGLQPSPYRCYALPHDFIHLSTGEDPYKLIDFLTLRNRDAAAEASSDEDDVA